MKQNIILKKAWLLLLVFICNSYLQAQIPNSSATFVSPGYNSCNAGGIASGHFSFPVPPGLTLSQLHYLGTDFKDDFDGMIFTVFVECSSGQQIGYVGFNGPYGTWVHTGNLTTEENFSQWKATYGSCTISSIILHTAGGGSNFTLFDNTIINTRTYNYDDCDQDGLLDIYDCALQNNGNNKVLVCHEGHTICVAQSALQAHLNHGDYLGSCHTITRPGNITTEEVGTNELILSPNPAINHINLRNNLNKPLGLVSIYDITGKMVYKNLIGASQATIDVKNFSPGVYLLRSDQMGKTIKFVKQ